MAIDVWVAFVIATAALLAIPGPVVILLLSHVLTNGRTVALAAVPGVILGDFVAMSVSLAGAGAVLAASATLFTLMKTIGALYMIWIGVNMIRVKPTLAETGGRPISSTSRIEVFRQAFLVTALNPKDIVFFVAFLPQFVDPSLPTVRQLLFIEATFLVMVALSTLLWIIGREWCRCSSK